MKERIFRKCIKKSIMLSNVSNSVFSMDIRLYSFKKYLHNKMPDDKAYAKFCKCAKWNHKLC